MRQLLVFALSRVKQLKVTEADDGVDGLRKLAAGKFDIILTDINMPIMDGLKLVKRVRTDPVHKDVPIVVITTESAEEDRQRALVARRERVHHEAHPGAAGDREGQGAPRHRGVRERRTRVLRASMRPWHGAREDLRRSVGRRRTRVRRARRELDRHQLRPVEPALRRRRRRRARSRAPLHAASAKVDRRRRRRRHDARGDARARSRRRARLPPAPRRRDATTRSRRSSLTPTRRRASRRAADVERARAYPGEYLLVDAKVEGAARRQRDGVRLGAREGARARAALDARRRPRLRRTSSARSARSVPTASTSRAASSARARPARRISRRCARSSKPRVAPERASSQLPVPRSQRAMISARMSRTCSRPSSRRSAGVSPFATSSSSRVRCARSSLPDGERNARRSRPPAAIASDLLGERLERARRGTARRGPCSRSPCGSR